MSEPSPVPSDPFHSCRCGHAWMHHDIEDMSEDPKPSCCVEGCPCGPGRYEFAARLTASAERHSTILSRLNAGRVESEGIEEHPEETSHVTRRTHEDGHELRPHRAWCGAPIAGWRFLGAQHVADSIEAKDYASTTACPECITAITALFAKALDTVNKCSIPSGSC